MLAAGADVWEGRWVIVVLDDGRFDSAFVAASIAEAVDHLPEARTIGVDMPIGLPAAGGRRTCDELARQFVGPRRSSVFWTPCAEVLETRSYAAARALAAANGWRGIAAQAYALKTQILAVQHVARRDDRLVEVHPEVSFAAANGTTLRWPKTSWNGMHERRGILRARGIELPPRLDHLGSAGSPDVLDAAIVAWSASRVARAVGEPMPPDPDAGPAIWR